MFLVKCSAFYFVQQGKHIYTPALVNIFQDALISSFRRLSITHCLGEENISKMVEYGIKEENSSRAMRAYLERSQAYNQFMENERKEYKTGKRHLANIMGKDPENFTEADVNEAVEYLFPSGLFVLKSRPIMKPPEEIHQPKKEAEFDETGRPYHHFFYTAKPNFYAYLHKLVTTMKELEAFEDTMIKKQLKPDPALALTLEGYQWLSLEQFENKFLENLSEYEHRHLINAIERLASHPYSYKFKDLIFDCRVSFMKQSEMIVIPKPELQADGRKFITVKECRRKTAHADVTVRCPGTGLISINGHDLSYFEDFQSREQLLFPLHFTGKINAVDIEASVRGGGFTGQSGAIRYGIAIALRSFVEPDMVEKMRLAGLLTKDLRHRERKKPGQAKARKKFTWKKR